MINKSPILLLFMLLVLGCTDPEQQDKPNSSSDPIETKVNDLLSKMTLKEKIGQLNQYSVGEVMTGPGAKEGRDKLRYERLLNGDVGSVLNLIGASNTYKLQKQVVENSRLGIPLVFSYDVIHGLKTMFPEPLGESASWDMEAIEESARLAAKESAASGLHWTFAPMVDISRDPRWGRVMEGAGEDPYLGSMIAKARIKGFQGDDLSSEWTIAACAKHFAGYGLVESGKDYNNVYVGRNTLMNTIIPPFKASVESGAATFMNAFNDIDGVPSTANNFLLRDILKGQWEYDGMVVSDWGSIQELIPHGTAADLRDAARQAITAGSDMDMEGEAYIQELEGLVNDGVLDEALIDDAAARVLRLKFRLGLFDDPYKYCDTVREAETVLSIDNLRASREVAKKSIVLLKNDGKILPLRNPSSVALIGPLVKDKDAPLGNWRGQAQSNSAVSVYEGLSAAFGTEVNLTYAEGCKLSIGKNNFLNELTIEKDDRSGFANAVKVAKSSDVVVMVLGEPAHMSGEARSRTEIGLPGLQLELLQEVYKVNKNIVLILMNGRPLTIPWEAQHIPTILETWHLGSEAGNAIADVVLGKYNPSGKLPISFPRSVGQIPVYYGHKNTGRPSSDPGLVFYTHYMDEEITPLFPFGYGLSYTTFDYSDISLNKKSIASGEEIQVSVEVTNAGNMKGEEVVQLYIRDMVASVTRPVKELKSFEKIELEAGEKKTVTFKLTEEDLSFYKQDLSFGTEPGLFKVFVGTNSQDLKESEFELK